MIFVVFKLAQFKAVLLVATILCALRLARNFLVSLAATIFVACEGRSYADASDVASVKVVGEYSCMSCGIVLCVLHHAIPSLHGGEKVAKFKLVAVNMKGGEGGV